MKTGSGGKFDPFLQQHGNDQNSVIVRLPITTMPVSLGNHPICARLPAASPIAALSRA